MPERTELDKEWDALGYGDQRTLLSMIDARYWLIRGGLLSIILITLVMGGCPQYKVWKDGLAGKAELMKAEWNRQITIKEAEAKKEAANSWADAEAIRAGGSARANAILAESLGGPEGYLRWLFIDVLASTNNQTIYLPTEAGMPILEAERLSHMK